MKLIQTQNPEIIKQIIPFWRKYLAKIKNSVYEAELNRLISCFVYNSFYKLFVLFDEKEKKIHGFCVMYLDGNYGSLILLQGAVDDCKIMYEELMRLINKAGIVSVYFSTERNEKAWERLIGAKKIGTFLELPLKK